MGFVKNQHRGCKVCCDEINGINDYIKNNQISFGKMSNVAQKWIKKMDKDYAFLSGDSKRAKEFKKDVFGRMWDSYNFSMR